MDLLKPLLSGASGALAVTLLNESVRRVSPSAPRLDLLGMQALEKQLKRMNGHRPRGLSLYGTAMVGDLLANSLYYGFVDSGKGRSTWVRGVLLGLSAGLGAVLLPPVLGLDEEPSARSTTTGLMTVGWYLAGGLAAAGVANLLRKQEHQG